jgi:predicted Zn-dependent protease
MSEFSEADHPRVMEVIANAIEQEKENDIAFATQILTDLVAEFPKVSVAHAYLGWIYSRGQKHREAIEQGRVAVKLSPMGERESVLLFRVLWGAGESNLAFEEMKRFLEVGRPEEYLNIIQELSQLGL